MVEARVMMGARPVFTKTSKFNYPFDVDKFRDLVKEALDHDMSKRPGFGDLTKRLCGLKKG